MCDPFCNGPHNVRSCPQRLVVTSGCVSFEDHLVECIFTTREGTDQRVQMEHDEDTATTQQASTHMAFKQCAFKLSRGHICSNN